MSSRWGAPDQAGPKAWIGHWPPGASVSWSVKWVKSLLGWEVSMGPTDTQMGSALKQKARLSLLTLFKGSSTDPACV